MSLLILLIVPLVASLALAIIGDRKFAPEVNILGSASTFAAGVVLALDVYDNGPMLAGRNVPMNVLTKKIRRIVPNGGSLSRSSGLSSTNQR